MSNLRRLFLFQCDLKQLDNDDCLKQLTNLEVLEFRDCCNCSGVNLGVLSGLKWLVLKNSGDFQSFEKVNKDLRILEVNLDYSPNSKSIKLLSNYKHERLEVLDVKIEGWSREHFEIDGYRSLKTLRMNFCHLKKLKISHSMNKLETLVLDQNNFDSIDKTWRALANLKKINLSMNTLKLDASNVFAGLKNLKSINISCNKILSIHSKAFQGLDALEDLNLSGNNLQRLDPEVFSYVPNLKRLDLSENELETEMSTSSISQRLKTLVLKVKNLRGSRLTSNKEGVFSCLEQLEYLDLSSNKISSVDSKMLKGLRKLKRLDLSENEIENVSLDAFSDAATTLEEINLKDNCLIDEMKDVLRHEFATIKISLNKNESLS